MIAAIYARKSTEQNGVAEEQKSVERQIANARVFAAQRGWTVDDAHVYVDDAISGAELEKLQGKMRMLDVIRSRRAPFDLLILQNADRLSRRDGAEAIVELKSIVKAGVAVWFYAKNERFTYGDFKSNVSGYLQAEFNAEYRRAIAEKTYEAMERKARAGHVTGGVVFGYDNVTVFGADGRRSHVERRINDREAEVVRRIFTLSAEGLSHGKIARQLNDEGAPAPRPRLRRPRPAGWVGTSVYEVLRRPLYRGLIVWNRSKKRDLDGEQKIHARPASDWIHVEAEPLRIVPEDLWQATERRLKATRDVYLRNTNGRLWGKPLNSVEAKYLLSGLAECGHCHGTLEVRSRVHGGTKRAGRRVQFYMCSTYRHRGASVCPGIDVPMARADEAVLSLLEAQLLDGGLLHDACAQALEDPPVPTVSDDRRAELLELKSDFERQIGRLTDALADGSDSRAIVDALKTRESALSRIERDLARVTKATPVVTPERVRRALDALLVDWKGTLRKPAPLARQFVAKLLQGRIVFTAERRDEQPGYRIAARGQLAPLITAALKDGGCTQALASPTGFEPVSWP